MPLQEVISENTLFEVIYIKTLQNTNTYRHTSNFLMYSSLNQVGSTKKNIKIDIPALGFLFLESASNLKNNI